MANLVAIQMTSTPNVEDNLMFVEQELKKLNLTKPCLVVLPECFACFGGSEQAMLKVAEPRKNGVVQTKLAALAKKYKVWLVAGSFPIQCENSAKYTASCLIFNDQGEWVDEYQKIHLFDVQVNDSTGGYKESANTQAGNRVVVVDSPWGKIGVAICYDIRFSGLFSAMQQAGPIDVLVLPAAFTQVTGEAHWHILLKARAIENQCFVVAANQTGTHLNKRQTYGHSCIISPWGETLAELPQQTGAVYASFEPSSLKEIRRNMPLVSHNKFRSYLV